MSVTVHLTGGVGNQLFIYATGLALARKLGTDLKLDISGYDSPNEWRVYSLGLFKGITAPCVRKLSGKIIEEKGMPYNPALFENAPQECSIKGYWQCEEHFKEERDGLRHCFMPKQELPLGYREIQDHIALMAERSVFLTVRRTDYVGNDYHGLLPMQYYLDAAILLKMHTAIAKPFFFVFSDEPQWCSEFFRPQFPYDMLIAGNFDRTVKGHLGREDAELWMMRQCRHAIMANSSYSWWGAWLGADVTGGVVVAPKQWFGPRCPEDWRDICPSRWTLI